MCVITVNLALNLSELRGMQKYLIYSLLNIQFSLLYK